MCVCRGSTKLGEAPINYTKLYHQFSRQIEVVRIWADVRHDSRFHIITTIGYAREPNEDSTVNGNQVSHLGPHEFQLEDLPLLEASGAGTY